MPSTHTQGDITYVSGGFGWAEQQALRRAADNYNLHLLFAVNGTGAYLADVKVRLVDQHGATVLDATSNGPYFMAQVPPGQYRLTADFGDHPETRMVTVPQRGANSQSFFWASAPVLTAQATSPAQVITAPVPPPPASEPVLTAQATSPARVITAPVPPPPASEPVLTAQATSPTQVIAPPIPPQPPATTTTTTTTYTWVNRAPTAPPPPRTEVVPPSPGPLMVWEPGHWNYTGTDWAWVPGHYEPKPQQTAQWIPGHWDQQPDGTWFWVAGRWAS